jgi:adenine phosphoribosyltransferase
VNLHPAWFAHVKDVPDWPKAGIVFKDVTPLLADAAGFRAVIDDLRERLGPYAPTQVVAVESRGFLFGSVLAYALGAGLTLVRKPGKLPRATRRAEYALEYGTDALEMHIDALGPGDRVVVLDDVLATGGTAVAVRELVEGCGATVAAFGFVLELGFLGGRARLGAVGPRGTRSGGTPVESLVTL